MSDEKFYSSSETMPVRTADGTQIGIEHSTTGFAPTLPDAVSARDDAASMPTVREVDQEMQALLPPSAILELSEVDDLDFKVVGYSLEAPCTIDDIKTAIAVIDEFSAPLPANEITKLLAKMFVKTKRKADDQLSQDLMFAAYREELSEWPADLVVEVLTKWPRQSMWWPSWHELFEELSWRDKRSKMKAALEKKLAPNRTQSVINQAMKGLKA